jgi:hypothetical protein
LGYRFKVTKAKEGQMQIPQKDIVWEMEIPTPDYLYTLLERATDYRSEHLEPLQIGLTQGGTEITLWYDVDFSALDIEGHLTEGGHLPTVDRVLVFKLG